MRVRSVIFWMHLMIGVLAGVVVLVMSVTGVALTYEKQMIESADRRAWSAPTTAAVALGPETLLTHIRAREPTLAPVSLTLRADPRAPASLVVEGNRTLLIDPYQGTIIGEPPAQPRAFFRTMTLWHRYLALEGASRATGKAMTGAANLGFLFIVLSGLYLWLPKVGNAVQFKTILWFRRGLPGKARDFNGTTSLASGRQFHWPSSSRAPSRSRMDGRATSFTAWWVKRRPLQRRQSRLAALAC